MTKSLFLILFLSATLWASAYQQDEMPHGDNFDMECARCHSAEDWSVNQKEMTFRHGETGFPLTGAHTVARCRNCHESLIFNQTGTACADCHTDIHKSELGFRCENCHTSQSWENRAEQFEQHAATSFPLTGMHALLDCQACHQSEQQRTFANTSTQCKSCHLSNYMQTLNPAHRNAGFSLNCENCHRADAATWKGAVWEHSARFPLRGAHARLDCADCHADNLNTPLEIACYSCHNDDYNRVQSPDHRAAKYSTECQTCHNDRAWAPADFDHNLTGFPLSGAHTSADCQACHAAGYANTPSECISCHEAEYTGTTNPDHRAAAFPTTCEDCHTTSNWQPADFDHSLTGFPLSGAHTSADCQACHAAGYANTPSECISCHEAEYTGTTNPDHRTAAFPTTCEDCHTTSHWQPADFDHDGLYFPIYSGKHKGEWNTCADCHVNPSDYSGFECINCHEHRQSKMDDKHKEVREYSYDSASCYSCHPNGNNDD